MCRILRFLPALTNFAHLMMRVLFSLIFLLAIIFPAALRAEHHTVFEKVKACARQHRVVYDQSGADNILLFDLPEDNSDDNTNESEKKRPFTGKSSGCITSLFSSNNTLRCQKAALTEGFILTHRYSLTIFLQVFRL
jgi:hypothetical protein